MITQPTFFGSGVAFPFRIDKHTGGVAITSGKTDDATVAIQYIAERWTANPDPPNTQNHVSEAIAHILATKLTEHDTLPPFGSEIHNILFEPNNEWTRLSASDYFKTSTIRWEKRAFVPDGGVLWRVTGTLVDQGELPCELGIEFILNQDPNNLVSPFVTSLEARNQEYRTGGLDDSGHDYLSRYYRAESYVQNGTKSLRFRKTNRIPFARDDQFYEVGAKDTWLLISYNLYGDIRYWWLLADMYISDSAQNRLSRDCIDTTGNPEQGTVLRVPSRSRISQLILF